MQNRDRGDRLLLTVARLNRWATRHADLAAPAAQLRLLSLISEFGPARIGDLAIADNSSQPTMTTQVQRLETLGYVSREPDASDGRATLVSITDAGRDVLVSARNARADVILPLMEGLSQEELDTIDEALTIVSNALAAQQEKVLEPAKRRH